MKVKFTIEQASEEEKDGMFKTKQVDMYKLKATFTPSELDKKTINNHPLLNKVLFMQYNELDKWETGLIFKDKHAEDKIKQISVGEIYNSPTYIFRAYSVPRIEELRSLVIEAGQNFARLIDMMNKLESSDEIEF